METTDLGSRWQALRTSNPGLRTRDAAAELGVSEAELVATAVGTTAVRLHDDADSLLHALTEVGRCMALTRNDSAVSEVRGRYGGIELGTHAGQVIGEHIDLRVFVGHWRHLYAIDEPHPQRAGERRRSIHVFDAAGTAVHKVYLEPEGDAKTWDGIIATRASARPLVIDPPPARRPERPDAEIDRAAFVAGWDAMNAGTIEEAAARIDAVGAVLHEDTGAHQLAAKLRSDATAARQRCCAADRRGPTAVLVYARGAGTVMLAGADTPAAAMLELAGARNAMGGFSGFKPISPEALVAAAPEVIVIPARGLVSLGGEAGLLAIPGVADTPAGRARRIVAVDDLLLLGFGPRLPAAIDELARGFSGGFD